MAQTNYTPILTYGSTTATNVPLAADLTTSANGVELAINAADGKLFYKDNVGVVQVLATKAAAQTSFSAGTTGLTPNTPTSGAVTLAGTLAVANGGTGVTTSTGTGSTVLSNSPILVTPALGTPSSATLTNATGLPVSTGVSGLGTGVATALAVNVGSAGAPVVNGGILGTPSSGTVTNLTGTASININGTVGATTPATASVTTLTASLDSSFTSTGALLISKGTTAQRTAGTAGQLRFNTTSTEFEGYNGTVWASVGGAALANDTTTSTDLFPLFASATTGTASTLKTSNAKLLYKPSTGELKASEVVSTNGISVNSTTVAASYTIASGQNALAVGPITIASGQTVTVSSGQRWVIL